MLRPVPVPRALTFRHDCDTIRWYLVYRATNVRRMEGEAAVTLPSALRLGVDPTTRRPLRDEAYLSLRRAILSGDFKPGDRLVEREVANKLDLSRSPVREAFRRLEQEGLVSVNRQGLFVQKVAPAEVEELYLIRQHLE